MGWRPTRQVPAGLRGRAGALAIIVLLAVPVLALAEPDQTLDLTVEPPEGDLSTVFRFSVDVPPVHSAPNLFVNPAFMDNGSGWAFSAGEIGGAGRATFREGPERPYAHLSITNASKEGTVYLYQTVNLSNAPAYQLAFDGRGSERLTYAIIIRERGFDAALHNVSRDSWDSVFRGGIASSWESESFTWTPRFADSRAATVYLRVAVPAGASGFIDFATPSFRPSPSLEWDLDGDGRSDSAGMAVDHRFSTPGEHEVRLRYVAIDGQQRALTKHVTVVNVPPQVTMGALRVQTGSPIRLPGLIAVDPDAPQLMRNGGFEDGLDGWQVSAKEIGGAGDARVATFGPLRAIHVRGSATANGTIYAYSALEIPPGVPLEFAATYRDEGVDHAWILRERSEGESVDTVLRPPPSASWREFHYTWTPTLSNASSLTVYLRYALANGTSGNAWFTNVSLQPGLNVRWDLDGDGAADAFGREPSVTFHSPGYRKGVVVARDFAGGEGRQPLEIHAVLPPARVALDGPEVAAVGQTVEYSVRGSESTPNLLPALSFRQSGAWRFADKEIGGGASWVPAIEQGDPKARLEIPSASKPGTVFLHQDAPVQFGTNYTFSVKSWDDGGIEEYAYILRERGFNQSQWATPRPWHDASFAFASAPAGAVHEFTWSPQFPDSDRVEVYLRVRLAANASAVVEWSEPRLSERLDAVGESAVTWQVTGRSEVAEAGNVALIRFDAPGFATVGVNVSGPEREPTRQEKQVLVLPEPARAIPTIRDGILFRWILPAGVEGNISWAGGGRADTTTPVPLGPDGSGGEVHEWHIQDPSPQGVLVFDAAGAGPFVLSNGSVHDRYPVRLVSAPAEFAGVLHDLRFVVRVPDPAVAAVALELRDLEDTDWRSIPMQRVGIGTYGVTVAVPWSDLFDQYEARVVAQDVYGHEAVQVLEGTIQISPLNGLDPFRPLLLGALAAVLTLAGRETWRHRRRRKDA